MDTREAAERLAALFPAMYRRFHRRIHHTEYQLTSEYMVTMPAWRDHPRVRAGQQ